jgi:membrane fusion protein, copper/silver efflux system
MTNMPFGVRHIVAAASLACALLTGAPGAQAQTVLHWEAVTPEVAMGESVRIEVRLTGSEVPIPADQIKVTAQRIDMGPDNMASMEAPLKPLPSPGPGVLAFETEFVMAGRWALTLSATVPRQAAPVSGTVIYTVNKGTKQSENAPARQRKIVYYRNPMGLPDVSPTPKKDSMGMDYIPVYADEASAPSGAIQVSLDKIQRSGVRTTRVERRPLTKTVRATGTVVPNEAGQAVVAVKFDGFIEALAVPVTGAEVRRGAPLMRVWIESPELLQKQVDYMLALRRESGKSDLAQAKHNLRLFDFPESGFELLRQTGQPVRSLDWAAPISGTVMEKPAVTGMRFKMGDTLFKLADLSTVWIIAEVAERDLSAIREDQPVRIAFSAYPGELFDGKVAFIYPELNMTARTARIRVEVPNPERRIKIGLYADVEIEAASRGAPVIAVPQSAVIDNGMKAVAFVAKGDGRFEPRPLRLGQRGDSDVEVKEGLAEGEEIVTTGNFLIDAESNLRAALAAFTADSGAADKDRP